MKTKNIVMIIADQLTWRALPVYGDTYVKTPNIDRIAKNAAVFDNAYTPCPLCQPARASFWTGKYMHETGVLSNGRNWPVKNIPENVPTIGSVFTEAGWETAHFGKTHDAGGLRGFNPAPVNRAPVTQEHEAWPYDYDTENDRDCTGKAVSFLLGRKDKRPLIMAVDLQNPHDICNWVGRNQNVHTDVPVPGELPELPPNFEFDDIANRPIGVAYICCSHNRQAQAAGWTPDNFRHYLAAYYHYIEVLDREVGLILDAAEKTLPQEETLYVFTADHGDSMASRGRTTKQVDLYEEVTHIPFMLSGSGCKPGRIGDNVSTLDLTPTLCAFAGIEAPVTRGVDLTPEAGGGSGEAAVREYVVSQWHTEWGFTVSPGRMLRCGDYKYMKYIEDGAEELYDLSADPWERKNFVYDPQYSAVLDKMRKLFERYIIESGDDFYTLTALADKRWRSHALGYQNHTGPAAPSWKG